MKQMAKELPAIAVPKEFYEIVAGQLSKDGVFVQWLGAYDYSPEDFNILLNTLNLIFPH